MTREEISSTESRRNVPAEDETSLQWVLSTHFTYHLPHPVPPPGADFCYGEPQSHPEFSTAGAPTQVPVPGTQARGRDLGRTEWTSETVRPGDRRAEGAHRARQVRGPSPGLYN